MTTEFFTSDTHFFHKKMWQSADGAPGHRPWPTRDAMHEGLINAWNSVVTDDDFVYHLGDFTFHHKDALLAVVDSLRFRQLIILEGNHDDHKALAKALSKLNRKIIVRSSPHMDLRTQHKQQPLRLVLNHFAYHTWENSHHGTWHLHGHSHGNLPPLGRRVDVGVDSPWVTGKIEFRPFSMQEIVNYMGQRQFVAVDHHVEDM